MNTSAIHAKSQLESNNFMETVYAFQKRAQQHNLMNAHLMTEERIQNRSSSGFLTSSAQEEMQAGRLLNLESLCYQLYHTFLAGNSTSSALQFIPTLTRELSIGETEWKRFLRNPKTKHILVQNPLMKVVLIHWKPGQQSHIHGHDGGGCIFKVLRGRIEEKRYTSDGFQRLLSTAEFDSGSIAYIDDRIAHHSLGNPFQESAVSLHVYCTCQ